MLGVIFRNVFKDHVLCGLFEYVQQHNQNHRCLKFSKPERESTIEILIKQAKLRSSIVENANLPQSIASRFSFLIRYRRLLSHHNHWLY